MHEVSSNAAERGSNASFLLTSNGLLVLDMMFIGFGAFIIMQNVKAKRRNKLLATVFFADLLAVTVNLKKSGSLSILPADLTNRNVRQFQIFPNGTCSA